MQLTVRNIDKNFGSLRALRDVSIDIPSGTVHALVGENGAGKSTLMKIISGIEVADSGTVAVNGTVVNYRSPRHALADGITIIAQELSLEPARTVEENVYLGMETTRWGLVDRRDIRRRFTHLAAQLQFNLDPTSRVGSLRTADQQKVEIMRAVAREAKLIIMDEPTAALTTVEASKLLETVHQLRDAGTTVIYVSHYLTEVLAVADSITVLRDGAVVRTSPAAGETPESLVASMLGHANELSYPDPAARPAPGHCVLGVRGLSRAPDFVDINIEVRAGEIVGLAGLIGSGRSEVARAIFGADPVDSGTVSVDGQPVQRRSPRKSVQLGISMLPESRKEQGLLMQHSIVDNVVLPHLGEVSTGGLISGHRQSAEAQRITRELDVRGAGLRTPIVNLSGGNQQKTLFAKWLFRRPKVFIIDEPTRGVDVGAKYAIYNLIDSLAREGMGVLVISSEIEEVMGLADRILVMRNGRITAEMNHNEATEDTILRAAFGASEQLETR